MKKRVIHLKKRIIVAFFAFACMGSFVLSIVFNALYVKEQGNVFASKDSMVYEVASEADYFLMESNLTIKAVAYSISDLMDAGAKDEEIQAFLEKQERTYAKSVSNDFAALYGVFQGNFYDGEGWIPSEGYDPKERPWYQAAVEAKGEVALISPYLDSRTHTILMSLSKLLPDRESVVSIDIALSGLQKIVEQGVANGDWLYALILDANGFVVAHSNSAELGKEYLEEDESFGKLIASRLQVDESPYFEISWQGKKYFVFSEHVMKEWHAVCIIEKSKLDDSLNQIWYLFFATLFTFLGCILFAVVRFNRHRGIESTLEEQIKVLTDVYDVVWYVRLQEDVYHEADPLTGAIDLGKQGKDRAEYALRAFMDGVTDERFKRSVFTFVDFSTLGRRMKGKNSIKLEFLDTSNQRRVARFVPAKWDVTEEPTEVLWLLETEEQDD